MGAGPWLRRFLSGICLIVLLSAGIIITSDEPSCQMDIQDLTVGQSTRASGGDQIWNFTTARKNPISTPTLADLDGDGTMEVVFASANDGVYALDSTGQQLWYNSDMEIVPMDQTHLAMDFMPPPVFPSVVVLVMNTSLSL